MESKRRMDSFLDATRKARLKSTVGNGQPSYTQGSQRVPT
jgi:hypothetical protein